MILKKFGYDIKLSLALVFMTMSTHALVPNPIISRNKPIYGSPSANIGNLVNGKFGDTWSVSNGSWAAIKVGGTFSKILINWNNTGGSWSDSIAAATSCKNGLSMPVDYDILSSSNSTNGADGDWTVVLSIKKNVVTARTHSIDFNGAQWVKMAITKGGGLLDEIEVFDITDGYDDTWFFPGTSITAVGYKSIVPAKNFADLVTESHPSFSPAIIRGGIGCINSTTMANDISKYLNMTRNVRFWAIEMGTNDAWGGSNSNVLTFKKNMQLIIDSCKANNIHPIIARIIGTDSSKAKWQVHPDFLKAIDSLTIKNNLIPGPDFFSYFSKHTSELSSDGVHPAPAGGASMYRLWAEKMDSLYTVNVSNKKCNKTCKKLSSPLISQAIVNGSRCINVKYSGTIAVHTLSGAILDKRGISAGELYNINNYKGILIIKCITRYGRETIRTSVL